MDAFAVASSAWSWSQFWVGSPIILIIGIFGLVAVTAVTRARPEDVPRVLAIVSSGLTKLAGRCRGRRDGHGLPELDSEMTTAEEVRHHEATGRDSGSRS